MILSPRILRAKTQFSHFRENTLAEISHSASIKSYLKGAQIATLGDIDEKLAFLLYGKVLLVSADGHRLLINHSDSKAKYSIGSLKPRQYTVTAESYDTCILWIHERILKHIMIKNNELYRDDEYIELIIKR